MEIVETCQVNNKLIFNFFDEITFFLSVAHFDYCVNSFYENSHNTQREVCI